eukprot:1157041-Pelagomonas_calceolata.AAC.3
MVAGWGCIPVCVCVCVCRLLGGWLHMRMRMTIHACNGLTDGCLFQKGDQHPSFHACTSKSNNCKRSKVTTHEALQVLPGPNLAWHTYVGGGAGGCTLYAGAGCGGGHPCWYISSVP